MYSKEKIENLLSMFKLAKPMDLKNGNGFLVYSGETIDNTSNSELKHKYENECKEIKNKTEKNIYRYYYYEKLENNNPLHATIVMMNPAFADSEDPDNTIKNIEKYFTKQLIERSAVTQKNLLRKAINLLKPGHEMVYSTCSILSCENEDIVAHSIKNENVEIVPIHFEGMEELPLLPTKIHGTLCVCPTDLYEGFFVAKIRKK